MFTRAKQMRDARSASATETIDQRENAEDRKRNEGQAEPEDREGVDLVLEPAESVNYPIHYVAHSLSTYATRQVERSTERSAASRALRAVVRVLDGPTTMQPEPHSGQTAY